MGPQLACTLLLGEGDGTHSGPGGDSHQKKTCWSCCLVAPEAVSVRRKASHKQIIGQVIRAPGFLKLRQAEQATGANIPGNTIIKEDGAVGGAGKRKRIGLMLGSEASL